jgi:hypothetical protein
VATAAAINVYRIAELARGRPTDGDADVCSVSLVA